MEEKWISLDRGEKRTQEKSRARKIEILKRPFRKRTDGPACAGQRRNIETSIFIKEITKAISKE
jgi:hypothetical protein